MTGPPKGPLSLYLVAGEPSGDRLGAGLMRALRAEAPEVRFNGVGGRMMAAEGLESRFDIIDLNVMGIAEVVPRLPLLLRRIHETAGHVVASRPDALITIDSPSFGLRVARMVRRRAPDIGTIHYVAPSVWAWRPGRARHMARFVDHVLALLPFEPPYMHEAGITCDFVGHPVAGRAGPPAEDVASFRARAGVAGDAVGDRPLLLVAPGSRKGEIRRMMPVFGEIVERVRRDYPELRVVVPVAETVVAEVGEAVAGMQPPPLLVAPEDGEAAKLTAFAAADFALVTSGTVVLEMAAADTPMISVYRGAWLSAAIMRRLITVDTANLVNLIGGENVVPEFLQESFTADRVTPVLMSLLQRSAGREAQISAFEGVMTALGRGGEPPSGRAARSVLRALGR